MIKNNNTKNKIKRKHPEGINKLVIEVTNSMAYRATKVYLIQSSQVFFNYREQASLNSSN